ncbi:MAG: tetratricopeptide repeat protein [Nitrospirales bacterium]|nr:tetratricopeptide repeat protein [Nitrospirales bacterium]
MRISKVFNPSVFWLAALPLVVYINSFLGDFQFDDFPSILENPHLDRWQIFVEHLDHMVRPVLYATFLFDRYLYAEWARGYHFMNVGLHILSGFLVYRIVLYARLEGISSIALGTAILFLIHPLGTETVTYLSGRASGLMTGFYLLAFLLYLRATEEPERDRNRSLWVACSLLAFLLAVGSKETAVTFPVALLLWDVLIRRLQGQNLRSRVLSYHMPFWTMVAVGVVVAIWNHPQYSYLADFSLHLRPLWDNVLSQIHAVTYAIFLFFAPWKQNFDHDLPIVYSFFQWPLVVDLMVLGGLITSGVLAIRRFPLAAFGIGWFFLQLLPTNSMIPRTDLLSERNLYLPSIGLYIAVVIGGVGLSRWIFKKRPSILWVRPVVRTIGLAGVLALCVMTVQRNAIFHDPVLLWKDTVQKSPYKARPHNNLGHSYALRGDWNNAIEEFRVALTLNPDYPLAQENLRQAYLFHVGRAE